MCCNYQRKDQLYATRCQQYNFHVSRSELINNANRPTTSTANSKSSENADKSIVLNSSEGIVDPHESSNNSDTTPTHMSCRQHFQTYRRIRGLQQEEREGKMKPHLQHQPRKARHMRRRNPPKNSSPQMHPR